MLRTLLLILSILLAVLGLGALAGGLVTGAASGVRGGAILVINSGWLFLWWYRWKKQHALQAELKDRRLTDGSRLADVIGRPWAEEHERFAAMAEQVADDLPDVTWIPGEGPRRVRLQVFKSEDRVIRFYVAGGTIKKVRIAVRPW